MSTFFLQTNDASYEIQHIGLSIFVLKRNKTLTRLNDCPEDVQEEIVKRVTDSVVQSTNNWNDNG